MWRPAAVRLRRGIRTVRSDLETDPLLPYVLAAAALLGGFWIWYRVPNFSGPDEYSRLLDPMETAGYVLADPGFGGLHRGVTDGRALGATFYLYGLVLAPLFVVVVVTGQLGEFASLASIASRWELWHAVPAWFWTGSILLARLVTVALAVGCVYLTYRLGTALRDRWTGRVAAAFFAVSFGLASLAHEAGEDVPMLFALLLATYLAVRYYQTGDEESFLIAAAVGGLTIAIKLNGGVVVFVLGAAYLLRRHEVAGRDLRAYVRPKLLGGALLLGALTVYVGFPSVLVGGPEHLVQRVTMSVGQKATRTQQLPIWAYVTRGYLEVLGLPLFAASVAGILASVASLRRPDVDARGTLLVVVPVVTTLAVYSQWEFVRPRHLVQTVPFLLLVVAFGLAGLRERRPAIARPLVVVLFASTLVISGLGVGHYAEDPRDAGTDWLATNADDEDAVEVYQNSVSDVAAIHGGNVQHYPYDEQNATNSASLVLNESAYTEWMVSMPERSPEYVQLTAADVEYLDGNEARAYPRRSEYVRALLAGDLGYEVVAKFGEPPADRSLVGDFLHAGLDPNPPQYEPYVVILKRTGDVTGSDGDASGGDGTAANAAQSADAR